MSDQNGKKTFVFPTGLDGVSMKMAVLIGLAKVKEITDREIIDAALDLLVDGCFDLEAKFIICNSSTFSLLLDLIDNCNSSVKAELLSYLSMMLKKSTKNLTTAFNADFTEYIIERIENCDDLVADLLLDILNILCSFSISVLHLKNMLKRLKFDNGRLNKYSHRFIDILGQLPMSRGPDDFFLLSGRTLNGTRNSDDDVQETASGIIIPPIKSWPYHNGWTFATWLRLDPVSNINTERDKPYVYCFRTSKGTGYSAHFVGPCLIVTSLKSPTKGHQHCVKFDIKPRRWYSVVICHVYSRWKSSDIRCYIDGQLVSSAEMPWHVSTNDTFDKCYIGCNQKRECERSFCGQMASIYVFSEALSSCQVQAMYNLGPQYKGHFCHRSESINSICQSDGRILYDGRMLRAIMFAYNPTACDGKLCLETLGRNSRSHFLHNPHALMLQSVEAVQTYSLHSTLHSIGGIQIIFPLFEQVRKSDLDHAKQVSVCENLVAIVCKLLIHSLSMQQQMIQCKGFTLLSSLLQPRFFSMNVLNNIICLSKHLCLQAGLGNILLRQLVDHILLNCDFWIYIDSDIQINLYNYLATEFLASASIYTKTRCVSTVLQLLHSLKYYYWVTEPSSTSTITPRGLGERRPCLDDILKIRSLILLFLKQLILNDKLEDDENIHSLFNYLATVFEDENVHDCLKLLLCLVSQKPSFVVCAQEKRNGVFVLFKLLACPNETVRVTSLTLIAYYLSHVNPKHKNDIVNKFGLYSLIGERLSLHHSNSITLRSYNALFEILIEIPDYQKNTNFHVEPTSKCNLQNAGLLKVIAELLSHEELSIEIMMEVKRVFLSDMIIMFNNNKENRRRLLQCSVWQDWVLNLAYIFPRTEEEFKISEMVCSLFKMLLHHSIHYEYGGWRVWVDTLAIVHAKVSFEESKLQTQKVCADTCSDFNKLINKNLNDALSDKTEGSTPVSSHVPSPCTTDSTPIAIFSNEPTIANIDINAHVCDFMEYVLDNVLINLNSNLQNEHSEFKANACQQNFVPPMVPFRIPEFRWSMLHQRLLSDLLFGIETDIQVWKSHSLKTVVDFVNSSDNAVFVHNIIHVIFQLTDNLIHGSGGILPLLSSATSQMNDTIEAGYGLSLECGVSFINRLMNLIDVLIFASSLSFHHLEQEKNLSSGGILRQSLRCALYCAVRNSLEVRHRSRTDFKSYSNQNDPIQVLIQASSTSQFALNGGTMLMQYLKDPEKLLQEMDINRLRACVYRDVEENKQAQFLALAVVYFTSIIMVGKYRDILEPDKVPLTISELSAIREKSLLERRGSKTESDSDLDTGTDEVCCKEAKVLIVNPQINGADSFVSDSSSDNIPSMTEINLDTPSNVTTNLGQSERSVFTSNDNRAFEGANISDNLDKSLSCAVPLVKEIFVDFSGYLSKTLLGSHGQDLLSDGLHTMKSATGVVELVMLLCSQEWQNSIQKNAGLAFIELINEGRILSHATREHLLRVANEAEYILNKEKHDLVQRHVLFESTCAESALQRRQEDQICDRLLSAAQDRDCFSSANSINQIMLLMTGDQGPWHEPIPNKKFMKLDFWEDNLRRRRRLFPNPHGSTHAEAVLNKTNKQFVIVDAANGNQSVIECEKIDPTILSDNEDDDSLASVADDKDEFYAYTNQISPIFPPSSSILLTVPCELIYYTQAVKGALSVTKTYIIFQLDSSDNQQALSYLKNLHYSNILHGKWHFSEIKAIFSRNYLLQNTALEFFLSNRVSVLLNLYERDVVKEVVNLLPRVGVGTKYGLPQTRRMSLASPKQLFSISDMTMRWQRREISNFQYLMFLNTISGRTYNDLNQYPVYPWIISNYESEELDLTLPSNFRDLSKPVGALNPLRAANFKDRYESWDDNSIPAFHYGTHFSTAGFVLAYLIRIEPFTTMFLQLQGGKFDHADRTFSSIAQTWNNCLNDTSDVKELIPEFFYLPEMFTNHNNFKFGFQDDGQNVNDVILPPWASDAEDFVRLNRMALESDFVSCQLHQWIDLIFGCKQRGPDAVKALNVFYHLTYEGAADLHKISNEVSLEAVIAQIKNFGQTPCQLTMEAHPPRSSMLHLCPMVFKVSNDTSFTAHLDFFSNSPIVYVACFTHPGIPFPTVVTISQSQIVCFNKWNNDVANTLTSTLIQENALRDKQLIELDSASLGAQKRYLSIYGGTERCVRPTNVHFVLASDNNFIFTCGFWDSSFRVYSLEYDVKLLQIIFGHYDIVTCICRSEAKICADCYIVTGSRDATLLIWYWNSKCHMISGECGSQYNAAVPLSILIGHDSEVIAVSMSAELGLIASASINGAVLLHSIHGELIRSLNAVETFLQPRFVHINVPSGFIFVAYTNCVLVRYHINGYKSWCYKAKSNLSCLETNFDGQYCILGCVGGQLDIIRCHNAELLHSYCNVPGGVSSLDLNHDNRFIGVGSSSGHLYVYHINFNKWHPEYQDKH